jgi:methylenetetrahydrofolate reductase (NADPH)
MRIADRLKTQSFTLSCELFPPKKGSELPGALEIVKQTAALAPDFISVTCGASGSTSKNTAALAGQAQALGVDALAHVTCVSATREDIAGILDGLGSLGVHNILALRGDLPEGYERPKNGFSHAGELAEVIRRHGGFCTGGACYPEGHVESPGLSRDLDYIRQKVEAGCDFLTTQMFFDNNILYRYLHKLHAKGVDVPVVAGIMPVTNKKQIGRIIELSNTSLPDRFRNILDRFGDSASAMEQAGVAYATEPIIDLVANGVKGIHIYTMNKPAIARKIIENLSFIVSRRFS